MQADSDALFAALGISDEGPFTRAFSYSNEVWGWAKCRASPDPARPELGECARAGRSVPPAVVGSIAYGITTGIAVAGLFGRVQSQRTETPVSGTYSP